ncbi:MAG: hypothetical protein QOJ90_3114 [Actinomycetota bacterium]|nr:hypothetical protein [Actinomycetota bacterium]MDQ1643763.1 hypothetical protein [Actinomycetota bacterium]
MTDDLGDFTVEIADQVESFVVAIREIAAGEDPDYAISLLLLEVSQLLLAGGRLGAISDVVPDERFEPDTGYDPDVEGLRTSIANLLEPIDEYHSLFDPYAGEPEVFTSRISDEVADIMSDLLHGLLHYRAGRSAEALWWWQFSYLSNWGSSASSVLHALHSVVSHVRLDTHPDEQVAVEDRLLAQTAAEAIERP